MTFSALLILLLVGLAAAKTTEEQDIYILPDPLIELLANRRNVFDPQIWILPYLTNFTKDFPTTLSKKSIINWPLNIDPNSLILLSKKSVLDLLQNLNPIVELYSKKSILDLLQNLDPIVELYSKKSVLDLLQNFGSLPLVAPSRSINFLSAFDPLILGKRSIFSLLPNFDPNYFISKKNIYDWVQNFGSLPVVAPSRKRGISLDPNLVLIYSKKRV